MLIFCDSNFNSSATASLKNPLPLTVRVELPSILKPVKSSPEKLAVPVTRSTLLVLIKPQPSQSIPLGFAIINPASPPNTSIVPSKPLPLVPVTCNRIRSASLPVILLFAANPVFPSWAVPSLALLFKIVPSVLTSKSST